MEKEISEDSYCTTDEGDKEEGNIFILMWLIEIKSYESENEEEIKDYVGMIEKIKKENIHKQILEVGKGIIKPSEIDTVVISSDCYFNYNDNQIKVQELSFIEKEFNLDNPTFPKALAIAIASMRLNEKSKILIKFSYIFKHYDKFKDLIEKSNYTELLYDDTFRSNHRTQTIIFEVTLHKFYMVQNLMDNGEIRKKILVNAKSWRYARNPDIATYDLSCHYQNQELYSKKNITNELDRDNGLYEIEKRIIQNVRLTEVAEVIVKPSYMIDRNKEFLQHYNLGTSNLSDIKFICEVKEIQINDYIFKPDKDVISKKRILNKGIGKDSPDRESFVKVKLFLKLNNEIAFSNFTNSSSDLFYEKRDISSYLDWREKINSEFGIKQLDEEDDYQKNKKIFDSLDTCIQNTLVIDLKLYSIPIVFRKVLIHMKRNEVAYVTTNFIDYFNANDIEIKNFSGKVEVGIHLFEFLHREQFSNLSYENKLKDLSELKEIANKFFMENKLYRASKIYQNINYRFNYGDVYGPDLENSEKKVRNENPQVADKLHEIRLSCHINLARAKLKLGKFFSAYEVTNKVLNDIDPKNEKALYIKGKSCIQLKRYEESVNTFETLNTLFPNNSEFIKSLEEARNIFNLDKQKQKNLFKKMIFSWIFIIIKLTK